MDELLNLTDDELNARAAMALGWREELHPHGWKIWTHGERAMRKDAWHPASNLDQAFQLQDEVRMRGLKQHFTAELMNLLTSLTMFDAICASARTRTIAAVYVLEGGK